MEANCLETDGTELWGIVFRKYYKSILFLILVGLSASYLVSVYVMTPKFEAFSTILYGPTLQTGITNISNQLEATSTYNDLLNSESVASFVIKKYSLPLSPSGLSQEVTATVNSSSLVSTIQVTDSDANRALEIANDYADAASEYLPTLIAYDDIQVVDRAEPDSVQKIRPRLKVNLILGFIIGLLIGVVMAFLRYQRNNLRKRASRKLKTSKAQS
jgi:capsular polysaccharide biosynthesis protein